MKRKDCFQKIDYKCNPCKILTPNYGPKMGYENITRKETVNNNITREESNVIYLKFKTI